MSNPFANWTPAMVAAHNDKTSKPIPVLEQPHRGSHLEEKFLALWTSEGGPHLERELVFAKPRRWRFDFAHLDSKTAIEIDGGVWNGRHTRGGGFLKDSEKLLAAHLLGWRVVRLTSPQLTADIIRQLIMRTNP